MQKKINNFIKIIKHRHFYFHEKVFFAPFINVDICTTIGIVWFKLASQQEAVC